VQPHLALEARTAVFDIVEKLVADGLLAEEGNDFYSLTEKGKVAAKES
jgi:Mn-dependent DtxR family transcriptional regulator